MSESSEPMAVETVVAAGAELKLIKSGTGEPILILHDEMGYPGLLKFHQAMAKSHSLIIPQHPGFGESGRR